jgi:hypothetical protein
MRSPPHFFHAAAAAVLPKWIEADAPAGKLVHVILDNDATHKHSKVCAWLDHHPRFAFHFTPTSSWLNAVEGYFAKGTRESRTGERGYAMSRSDAPLSSAA